MREAISCKQLLLESLPSSLLQDTTGQSRCGTAEIPWSIAEVPGSQTETLEFSDTQRVFPYPLDLLWRRDDSTWYFIAAEFSRGVCLLEIQTCPAAQVLPAENTPAISAVPCQPLQAGGMLMALRRLRGEGEVCSVQPGRGCN